MTDTGRSLPSLNGLQKLDRKVSISFFPWSFSILLSSGRNLTQNIVRKSSGDFAKFRHCSMIF